MSRAAKKCPTHPSGEHVYHPQSRGSRVVCSCGDAFPCRHVCGHLDCATERGTWPDPAEYPLTVTVRDVDGSVLWTSDVEKEEEPCDGFGPL